MIVRKQTLREWTRFLCTPEAHEAPRLTDLRALEIRLEAQRFAIPIERLAVEALVAEHVAEEREPLVT